MSWHPFFRIDNGFAKGRSSVTAVARNPDHLDLFVPETLVTLETGSNLCALYSHVRWTTRRMLEPSSTLSAKAPSPQGLPMSFNVRKMRRCRAGPFHIFARAMLRLVSPTWSRWTSRFRRSARPIGPRHWQPIAGICCGGSMGLAALKPERSKAESDQEGAAGHLRRSSRPWPPRAGVSWPEWDLSRRTNGPRLEDSSNDVAAHFVRMARND